MESKHPVWIPWPPSAGFPPVMELGGGVSILKVRGMVLDCVLCGADRTARGKVQEHDASHVSSFGEGLRDRCCE